MIYLLLSVLFSTGLFILFKLFGKYNIDVLKAIFINYVVAFALGFLTSPKSISFAEIPQQPWFLGALVLGLLFVSVFYVMAITADKNGVSVASVAGKMSVVVPVFFGVFLYDEKTTIIKILGIVIALVAVYMVSVKSEKKIAKSASLLFPILLFFGSGTIDTLLKYIQTTHVQNEEVAIFSGSLFGIAALFAFVILLLKYLKTKQNFGFKNVIAGIVLGIPNYFSIIFLIKALQVKGFESSTLFTINNVGIVLLSTIVGSLFFKEHFSLHNKIGIALAIVGIVLVTFST